MSGPISSKYRTGLFIFLLAFVLLPAFATGCHRVARVPGQDNTEVSGASGAPVAEIPPSPDVAEPASVAGPAGSPTGSPPDSPPAPSVPATAEPEKERAAAVERPEERTIPGEIAGNAITVESAPERTEPPSLSPSAVPAAPSGRDTAAGREAVATLPKEETVSRDAPTWARQKEELAYKVEFLGITMGYARFSFLGKVQLSGGEAYHLRVRAWTSDLLSIIYPIDDTIDYYLDVQTLLPLRQEFTRSRKEDDVAIFDQEKGTIVYRYRKDGKVRKKVDVLPNVYDPVSVAYYFRTRDLETEKKELSMYAGRKLWEISAIPVGFERIRTDRGEFDTIVVQPLLKKDGKVEDEKKMRMWMTRDDRHVPVRVYAKFKKIRTWTLVGELLPDREGG